MGQNDSGNSESPVSLYFVFYVYIHTSLVTFTNNSDIFTICFTKYV